MPHEDDQLKGFRFVFIYMNQLLNFEGCIQFADITSLEETGFTETLKYSLEGFLMYFGFLCI